MIPIFNNPPSSLTNYDSPNDYFKINDSPSPKTDSKSLVHDKILNYLLQKGAIDKNGCLNLDFVNLELPYLKKAQFDRIQKLFTTSFTVISKDNLFQFDINLKDLICYLKVDRLEIVGGTVYWILGEEYLREVCKELNIPEELIPKDFFSDLLNPAADIDVRVLSIKDPNSYKKLVCEFLATQLPEKFNHLTFDEKKRLILKNGLTKYFTQLDEESKEHFGVVSFGNRSDFSIDLLFIEKLKRKNLFVHDALKIVISRDVNKEEFSASLNSNERSALESLILKITKVLNTENLEGIDTAGACMIFSYLSKGWRYHQPRLESTLVATFLKSCNFSLLSKLLLNHYPNEPLASTVVCFNACSLMPEDKNLILNFSKQILVDVGIEKNEVEILALLHFNKVMMHLNEPNLKAVEAKQYFDTIKAYFQIFGFLSTALIDSVNSQLSILSTTINKEPFFQIKFKSHKKPLLISVKNDSVLALKNFKEAIKNRSLLNSLQVLSGQFTFHQGQLKISKISVNVMESCNAQFSEYAFDFLEDENCLIKQMGFYLLCHSGMLNQNSSYLTHLILKLPDLLKNEKNSSVKRNLIYSLLKYWLTTTHHLILVKQREAIEAFYDNIDKYDIDHKIFCLTFSKFEIREISHFIFKTWQHLKIFDLQSNIQLLENFKDHDPYSALKILKKLSEETSSKYEELKKCFDSLVVTYARLENKLLEERDLLILADIAENLISKLSPFKQSVKQDEMKYFIEIIRKTVKLNFLKAANLLKKLEEKNGYNKGLRQILEPFSKEDKLKFIHQLIEKPLDLKATKVDLVERIEQFVSFCTIDSDADLLVLAEKEILKALSLLFKGKKPGVVKLKEILTPHLGWLLAQLLNEIKSHEKPQEIVILYFKITEAIQPKIICNEHLILSLILGLKTILFKDDTQYVFVNTNLAKLGNRNYLSIGLEELQLYRELAAIYLKKSQTKVASDFVKKLLSALHSQNKSFLSIIEEFNGCFDQFILHKQSFEALALLEHYENLFSEDPLPNETTKWKALILSFDQNQNIKKLEILSKKSDILKNDEELLKIAKEIVPLILSNRTHFKDKTKTALNLIFELIKGFHISDPALINHLRDVLIPLNDKITIESFFTMYQGLGVSLSELTPLFKPLSNVNSEIVSQFLENQTQILVRFNEKDRSAEKKELIQEFISGLLKCKLMTPVEIDVTFSFLENELKLSTTFTIDQQNEINLKYCKSFISLENHDKLNMWKKLIFLSLNTHKKEEIKELLQLFIKGMLTHKKNNKPEKDLEPYVVSFLKNIKSKVTPLEMLPYFNLLSVNPSDELLALNIYFALKIIENCPIEKPENIKEPYLQFKLGLKQIMNLCFEKNIIDDLVALGKFKCFTSKEIYSFSCRASIFFFEHEDISQEKENISISLKYYHATLTSTEICPEFENASRLGAINALLSLIFIHDDAELYEIELISIITKIISGGNSFAPNKSVSPTKYSKDIIKLDKFFQFLFHLIKLTTAKILANKDILTKSMVDLIIDNIKNFKSLMKYTEKKDEIITLALEASFVSTLIPTTKAHGLCVDELQRLVKEMKTEGFLSNIKNDESIQNCLQLVAIAELQISDYGSVPDIIRAKILLDIITKILKLNTQQSTAISFYFFNQNYILLKSHFENEALLLLSQFRAVNYGLPENFMGDDFVDIDLFALLNGDYGNRGK